jgi:RND family efflux transporter MFP subunit
MKRIIVLGLAAAASLTAACARKARAPAAIPEKAFETSAVILRQAPATVELEGMVVGRQEIVLASRLAAPVTEVTAVPGQRVRAGTVLVRLEAQETEAALAGARSALAAARAAWDLASKNRQRYENLASRGAAAAIELDRARQEEAAAAASVSAAEASARRAETDREEAALAAPFDAVVVEKMVSAGDLAEPGRPLVRLASVSGRRVEAAPAEAEAASLAVGNRVEVVLASGTISGRIGEIVGAVDPATRRRTIRVDLPQGCEPAVGSFARVLLPGPTADRLLVSARGVVERGGLELAWTVEPDGGVALRYIRTGAAASDGLIEVRSGLAEGDRVVLDPPADLAAGTRVRS